MNLILFDDERREHLLPLTFTRPVADLRVGILRIIEKWELISGFKVSFLTQDYLSAKFKLHREQENILIPGNLLPDQQLFNAILSLGKGEVLLGNGNPLAFRDAENNFSLSVADYKAVNYPGIVVRVMNLWDIFTLNAAAIESDFDLVTKGRVSAKWDDTNKILGDRVFIEEGATVSCSVLNSKTGSIYIGKNAEVWEGSLIRGGFALCEGASVKMGAKVYGATTVGPFSRIGGEVSNSVIHGYSNKGHDGFLGNSVLGEWCNIGADSNNSNLKNNYSEVKLWNYPAAEMTGTGLQFCGLIMGDHSKCGINTMFNTGTVVGVSANIFGAGFPPGFIPSFSWGSGPDLLEYRLEKAIETAERMFLRRNKVFDKTEAAIFGKVYEITQGERK